MTFPAPFSSVMMIFSPLARVVTLIGYFKSVAPLKWFVNSLGVIQPTL